MLYYTMGRVALNDGLFFSRERRIKRISYCGCGDGGVGYTLCGYTQTNRHTQKKQTNKTDTQKREQDAT